MAMSTRVQPRYMLIGLGFLCVLVLVVALVLAQYNRAFDTTVPITINANRSGLLMEPGAAVKLRGVEIGTVTAVSTDGDGARITADLKPDQARQVPAEVSANLVPATVFGAKYVELRTRPQQTTGEHISAGTVIGRANVTVELDNTFDAVIRTLRAMPPSKLNGALHAVSDSLRGNGRQAGELIDELDGYLRGFNPNLPDLAERLPQTSDVANDYRGVTDDLAATASNLGGTSATLVDQKRAFAAFLRSLTHLGNSTGDFLRRNGDDVVTTLDILRPTSRVLARYSPVLPCFLRGVVHNTKTVRSVMGGPEYGGTHPNTHVTISALPGVEPYRYPRDLPTKGLDTGPDCHGLPVVRGVPPFVPYDTGAANPYPNRDEDTSLNEKPLALMLFGPLSPLGGGR